MSRIVRSIPPRNSASAFPWRVFWTVAVALLISASIAASAQKPMSMVPGPIEPGTPGGNAAGWEFTRYNIPNLPQGTSLGAVWTTPTPLSRFVATPGLPGNDTGALGAVPDLPDPQDPVRGGDVGIPSKVLLYVMAIRGVTPAGTGGYGAVPDPGDPDKSGGPSAANATSALYQWDGRSWTVALNLPEQIGRTVFGTSAEDVFAASNGVGGQTLVYHFDGRVWARQQLPVAPVAEAGAFAGKPGDVFFRAGETVFHNDGRAWTIVHTEPLLKSGGSLVYLAPDEVYAIGTHGHLRWDGVWWRWATSPALGIVKHAWGMRDASGVLAMYATGICPYTNQVRVWKFTETVPGTMVGSWGTPEGMDLNDPDASRSATNPCPGPGAGTAVWGTSASQIYASAAHHGECGRFYVLLKSGWMPLWQHNSTPPPNDIISGRAGELWMPLANGQMMHATPPTVVANGAPDCSGAVASPDVLPLRGSGFAAIQIAGISDPEGDAVTVKVMEITQDEPVTNRTHRSTCPDAKIATDGTPMLRVERDARGNGRVYRIAFEATDAAGNTSGGFVKVCVPKNAHWDCVDDGVAYRSMAACPVSLPAGNGAVSVTVTPRGGALSQFEVSLAAPMDVRFVAFDVSGRRVATIGEGRWEAGVRTVEWNAENVPSGLYFCRLTAGGVTVTKTVLVKR